MDPIKEFVTAVDEAFPGAEADDKAKTLMLDGEELTYFDPTFDGPTGTNVNRTQFGTCTSFSIPTINGQEAVVMRVPGDLTRRIGYKMTHGIAPNGGGTRVNQYTLIMDIMVDTSGPGAASLLQVSDPNGNRLAFGEPAQG